MKKLILTLLLVCQIAIADTTAIVNAAVESGQITREDARNLYLMKSRRWEDGQLIILFQMPQNSSSHKAFVREVLGMSTEQYNREWDRLVNAGLSGSIRSVANEEEMMRKVGLTPNALGYVSNDRLIVHNGENYVRTLRIIP